MRQYKLGNGLRVFQEKRNNNSVTIQVTVKVGSNHESKGIRGISHFIEHMLFEGTRNRENAKEISNEIESVGGEINAYTDNVRTCYYVKVPKKHFEKGCEILSDMMINPLFRERDIEKERQVILKEINIFNDESRYFQWILFLGSLYRNHPSRWPAYGTREDVKRISREDMIGYFERFYTAENSLISIVGNVLESKKTIEKYFSGLRSGRKIIEKSISEPANSHNVSKKRRKILNSYMVLGYKTVPRAEFDSIVLDVIQGILGRGQSGRMFDEIRNKRGLAYEVGVMHEPSTDYGYFSVYCGADKRNIPLIRKIIIEEFRNLSEISEHDLNQAKEFIEGKKILDNEDTHNRADDIAFWHLMGEEKLSREYTRKIKSVTRDDIKRVSRKFLDDKYTLAIIEQER